MSSNNNSGNGWGSLTQKNGSKPPKTKKGGQQKSSSRANKKRISNTLLKTSRSAISSGTGALAREAVVNSFRSASNNKLSFEDTIKIMNKQRNPESEITNKELEEIENVAKDQQKAAWVEKGRKKSDKP